MSWRAAKSLIVLRDQVNAAYPNRSKASDGLLGDAAHAASASDHNPNRNGVVCALDLTHDPANGFDAHALAEHLRVNRHPNLRYVISNARIAGAHTGWQWRPSVGHYQHCHISVGTHGVGDGQTYDNYDSTQAWDIGKGGDMPITKEQENELSILATGSYPGKDYNYKFTGTTNYDGFYQHWAGVSRSHGLIKKATAQDKQIKDLEARANTTVADPKAEALLKAVREAVK